MNQQKLNSILKKHQKWLNNEKDGERAHLERAYLERANLERAHLERAHLERAYLEGAHLDFSCWPLWCGSFGVNGDDRLIAQLVAHITRINVVKPNARTKGIMKALNKYADDFCEYRTDVPKLKGRKKKGGE
jgi:uncharacterized protein YjbI with pentapeptide repeats